MNFIHELTALNLLEELTNEINSSTNLNLSFSLSIHKADTKKDYQNQFYDINVEYTFSGNTVFKKTVRFESNANRGTLSDAVLKIHAKFMHEVFMEGLVSLKFKQANKEKDEN